MSRTERRKQKRPACDGIYNLIIKRVIDILLSALALIVLSPIIIVSALLVKLTSKGPAVFRQKRLGRNGKEFTIYKLRTMFINSEHTGSGVYSDNRDPRMTRIGKLLRKTSIDELPQLINILRGDMSLIGPRPPLTYHPWVIDKYSEHQRHMFDVRPGITGWAQIHGRKDVEWNKRIELNIWYVDHVSFLLDLKILFVTFSKVFSNADNENKGATVISDNEKTAV